MVSQKAFSTLGWLGLSIGLLTSCGKGPPAKTESGGPAAPRATVAPVFEEITPPAGMDFVQHRIPGHRAMSVTALDYDLDGNEDLYVSNDATPNLLLANDGQGRFKDVALTAGVAFNQFGEAAGSMGAAVGDSNGDGFLDLLVTRFGNGSLYLNSGKGLFEDRNEIRWPKPSRQTQVLTQVPADQIIQVREP